jgi:hypothetical protein
MDNSDGHLVDLGGIEYRRRPCRSCRSTGRRYDPTLADNVHAIDHGWIQCPACRGKGVTLHITAAGLVAEGARQDIKRTGELTIGDIAAGARAVYIPVRPSPVIAMTFEPTEEDHDR